MSCIVYQTDKKTGIKYAYESISYWDKEKKQPRSTRKYLGRVDEETGEIIYKDEKPKRGADKEAAEASKVSELKGEVEKRDNIIKELKDEIKTASIIADILYRKFVLSLPFHRQAIDYSMSGIDLSKQVILHWVNAIVSEFFDRIRTYMTEYFIRSGYMQSDESYFQVNKDERGPGHKGFMWIHCTSEMLDIHPVIVFYYEATRGTEHLRQLFGEFIGYIICGVYCRR